MTRDRIIEIITKAVKYPAFTTIENTANAILAELPIMRWTTEVPTDSCACWVRSAKDKWVITISLWKGELLVDDYDNEPFEMYIKRFDIIEFCIIPLPEDV